MDEIDVVEVATKTRHLHLLRKLKGGRMLTAAETRELAKFEKKTGRKKKAKKKTARIADEQIIKTQKQAAAYAGTTPRTIRRWVEEGMPVTEDGHYIRGMLDIFKANKGRQQTETKTKSESADAEYKDAKAKLMQMELELKRGQLVPKQDYDKRDIARILAVKRALLGQGRKLANKLAVMKNPRKIQSIIDSENRSIIEGFAK